MIGQRLKRLREEKGLTQQQLADELHLTYHAVSGYERNNSEPDDEILINIATYFHVSSDYLLGLSDMRNPTFKGENKMINMMKELNEEDRKSVQEVCEILIKRFKEGYEKK